MYKQELQKETSNIKRKFTAKIGSAFSENFHKQKNYANIHSDSLWSQYEPIWTNLKQSEIWSFYNFFRVQSELIWVQYEANLKSENSNLKSEKLIWHNLKVNSREKRSLVDTCKLPIPDNIKQSEIWRHNMKLFGQSESNLKSVWSQSEKLTNLKYFHIDNLK